MKGPEQFEAGRDHTIEVKFYENEWSREDLMKTSRPHLLMTLADVTAILIRAEHVEQTTR